MRRVLNITRNELVITLIGPAILGGVLGFIVYLAWDVQAKSPVVAVLMVIGGVLVVSLAAYVFRRFLLPHDKKDLVD